MTGNNPLDPALDDLPPSGKFVFDVVERHEEISRDQLLEETGLQERTLDRALSRLENRQLIRRDREPRDLRCVRVSLRDIG